MTKEQQAVLMFIKAANGGEYSRLPNSLDFNTVLAVACQQGVVGLCLDGVEKIVHTDGQGIIPIHFILQLYARKNATEKTMAVKRQLSEEFTAKMQPLQCIVLKGVDYAKYWPNPLYREFGDLDCWYGNNFQAINEKAERAGMKVEQSIYKHSHVYYKGLIIENHQALTEYDGTKIGEFTEKKLQELIAESCRTDTLLGSPNELFTACFMLKHAQMHFMYEGIELRHFLDWMYFVEKAGDEIDWERLNGLLNEMKLHNFADMMTAYCITRLGWEPKVQSPLFLAKSGASRIKVQSSSEELLDRVDDFVFSEKADVQNKQPIYRAKRIIKRFIRAWHFRHLHHLPYHKAVWTWIAYASTFDRKPQ